MKEDFCEIYLNWLRQNMEQVQITDNISRITLPFLDKDNDEMDIYIIRKPDSGYLLTDDGAVINNLLLNGIDLTQKASDRRQTLLSFMVNSYGVTLTDRNELTVSCSAEDLALKKHMLTQCMLKVGDMFYTAKPNVQSLFFEDVQGFLDENHIRYTAGPSFTGKSKMPSKYDFVIPKSDISSERLITTVQTLNRDAVRNIIFSWTDTREARPYEAELYAFIADGEGKRIPNESIQALKEYSITPALWSRRKEYIDQLTA